MTETTCCDLGKTDPSDDDDGIVIAVCQHRLDGTFERYWDEDNPDDVADDPSMPLIYVSTAERHPGEDPPTLPWNGCGNDDCPDTALCQTHYENL